MKPIQLFVSLLLMGPLTSLNSLRAEPSEEPGTVFSEKATGTVEEVIKDRKIVLVRTEPYGALAKLSAGPRSVILINGKTTAVHHLFIRDRVDVVRYDKLTNEILRMEISRFSYQQNLERRN